MRFGKLLVAAALLGGPLTIPVSADDKSKVIERQPADKEPTTDKEFLIRALATEMAEVKFADVAAKSASREEVRSAAKMIAADHRKVRDEFVARAKAMKLAVVEGLEKSHREQYDRLGKLKGDAFDREYVRHLADGHDKSAKLYAKWAADAKDEGIRKAADTALRKVKEHGDHINTLRAAVKE